MSHLVDYEQAIGEKAKALTAIQVVRHKNSKRLAWGWADTAIEHAEAAGIEDAGYLVADGRWPEMGELKKALLKLRE